MEYPLEYFIMLLVIVGSSVGAIFILKIDWRGYGLLFILSGIIGNIICILFVVLNFYSFPVVPFHFGIHMPYTAILIAFPYYVLLGVRFSPRHWYLKIPFYWAFVHIGVLAEKLMEEYTSIIEYGFYWDTFDSYATWWVYLLVFEFIGGKLVSDDKRRPIQTRAFWYGRWAWFSVHFILIITIFLAGVYVGTLL